MADSWGGFFDWGNGSVSVNGGQKDNTLIYIGAGLIALLIIFKNKK
ncbi:hypothetical protein [Soonwooa purpurea]